MGAAQAIEFLVNGFTGNVQRLPAVAMEPDGHFVVTWQSTFQDGDGRGIYAQRYEGIELVHGDFDGDGKADVFWRHTVTGQDILWRMDGLAKDSAGSIGTVPVVWEVQ